MRFYITLLTLSLLATLGASAAVFIVLNADSSRQPNTRPSSTGSCRWR